MIGLGPGHPNPALLHPWKEARARGRPAEQDTRIMRICLSLSLSLSLSLYIYIYIYIYTQTILSGNYLANGCHMWHIWQNFAR